MSRKPRPYMQTFETSRTIADTALNPLLQSLDALITQWETTDPSQSSAARMLDSLAAFAKEAGHPADPALLTLASALSSFVTATSSGTDEQGVEIIRMFAACTLLAMREQITRGLTDADMGASVAEFHQRRALALARGADPVDLIERHSSDAVATVILEETHRRVVQSLAHLKSDDAFDAQGLLVDHAPRGLIESVCAALMLVNLMDGARVAEEAFELAGDLMLPPDAQAIPRSETREQLLGAMTCLERFLCLLQVDQWHQAHAAVARAVENSDLNALDSAKSGAPGATDTETPPESPATLEAEEQASSALQSSSPEVATKLESETPERLEAPLTTGVEVNLASERAEGTEVQAYGVDAGPQEAPDLSKEAGSSADASCGAAPPPAADTPMQSLAEIEPGDATAQPTNTNSLDSVVEAAGEISVSSGRIGERTAHARSSLLTLNTELQGLYALLRQMEAELELRTGLGSSPTQEEDGGLQAHDVKFARIQALASEALKAKGAIASQYTAAYSAMRDAEEFVSEQIKRVSALTMEIDRARAINATCLLEELHGLIEATLQRVGKRANVQMDLNIEVDPGILERVRGPLHELVENAAIHGVDLPAERANGLKPPMASVSVIAHRDGNEVVFEVGDDGSGVNVSALNADSTSSADAMSAEELIFEAGISTSGAPGNGLTRAREAITSLGGRLTVKASKSAGTIFEIRVPATTSFISAVPVRSEGHLYTIPSAFVDKVHRPSIEDLTAACRSGKILVPTPNGTQVAYAFKTLGQLICAGEETQPISRRGSVLLMHSDRLALHVDEMHQAGDYAVRKLGPQVAAAGGVLGATFDGAGIAALLLDPARIVRQLHASELAGGPRIPAATPPSFPMVAARQ